MGVVYEAYDRQLDRKVALKFLKQAAGPGVNELRERMLREAKALARDEGANRAWLRRRASELDTEVPTGAYGAQEIREFLAAPPSR